MSATSSPNTSPSSSPTETSSGPLVSSPPLSDVTPYPACGISPAKLAVLIERGEPNKLGVSAGPRPLVLDLRANPDFDPVSIVHSININLPTLLMRRYRRGGAVSSFALESFITMPSDKELYHLIQDGWRQDQGHPAWTLVNVLERGGGNCGGSIRLWYLEGGFEAFQAWDLREKFLMRPGSIFEMSVTQEEQGQQQDEISCILPNFLYLGPEIATAEQVRELERLGIKRVLNMARECEDLLVVNHSEIEYHKVGVQDHVEADVSAGLLQAVDVIAASNDLPIYVHCKAGKSRSVTAIIAYLITQLHWSLNKAYNHVLTQRPCMCPNIGFVTELMRMEERTLGTERAAGMARAGSLNSILSLSTAGAGSHGHHHHHHSLQHHHSLSMGGSPKVLSTKSSMNSLAILSPFQ
ncbi:protein-tyrosine phosphatase-like protein [Dissophora ornata]|nr:protein-tyrosine phosphatase-like protein [Dissophora ornata]